jgi:putative membrane protein
MKLHKYATITAVAALAVAFSGSVRAAGLLDSTTDKAHRGQLSEKDYKFVKEAAQGGMSEVELGNLAKQKGTSQAVKDYGERMVRDHSKANDELKQIASSKSATLPADLTHSERSTMDKLQKASGADFDREYTDAMVKDHRTDVKEFQDAAQNANDPEIKSFAQKTLPTLQEHLRLAEDMQHNERVSPTGR